MIFEKTYFLMFWNFFRICFHDFGAPPPLPDTLSLSSPAYEIPNVSKCVKTFLTQRRSQLPVAISPSSDGVE